MLDAIGPSFRNDQKRRIDWSKIPFHVFSPDPVQRRQQFAAIRADMETFASRVSRIGYNSVSLDDVAHLTPDPWLEPEQSETILSCQEE
ncbi:MAG: hypothetical protein ACK5PS_10425 [Desulfopila sp.]